MATVTVLRNPSTTATLDGYDAGEFYCELLGKVDHPNPELTRLWHRLQQMELTNLSSRAKDAERELFMLGITFTVYSDRNAIDRILPFDVIPRVITSTDWAVLEAGIKQRVKALNEFIWDVYHERRIFKDGVVPTDLVFGNSNFRPEMVGYNPPAGTYIHIAGTDIIRDESGRFMVLEDNSRTPSGVSYVVENRHLMQRAFPDMMDGFAIEPVSDYGMHLANKLSEVAPAGADRAADRASVAGRVQLRLFRAHLPCPRDGRAAGRGPRSVRRRRPPVHARPSPGRSPSTSSTAG